MSWYISIRVDEAYSSFTDSDKLISFLSQEPSLLQEAPLYFKSRKGTPWVLINACICNESGCYATNGEYLPQINVVELVCSVFEDQTWYEELATRIAQLLDWQAVEENAERIIWQPV